MVRIEYICCHFCQKCVSTAFQAVLTELNMNCFILRAIVVCPECIEAKRVIIPDTKQ